MQNKILLSFREGCSGNWLAELLVGSELEVFYRQDRNGAGVPREVFHFDGNIDSQVHEAIHRYTGQQLVTCHSTNYSLLEQHWPDFKIVRIQPQTHMLDSIESAYNKLGRGTDIESVDMAFEYIKDYVHLHTIGDPLPKHIIDYGQLRYPDKLITICKEMFGTKLTRPQLEFAKKYWAIQDGKSQFFKVARYIYEYEQANAFEESDRLWTISDAPDKVSEISSFLKYQLG